MGNNTNTATPASTNATTAPAKPAPNKGKLPPAAPVAHTVPAPLANGATPAPMGVPCMAQQGTTYSTPVPTGNGTVTLYWALPAGGLAGAQKLGGATVCTVNMANPANWLGGNGAKLGAHLCHTYANGALVGTMVLQYKCTGAKGTPKAWYAMPYTAVGTNASYSSQGANGHAQTITAAQYSAPAGA